MLTDALALAAAFCYSTGRILTHAHHGQEYWVRKRKWLLGWDLYHLASFQQNWLPLWSYYMVYTHGGSWWGYGFLTALWLPWQLFRPAHWGPSLWNPRRLWPW
jgi:hypothetical protein